MKTITIQIGNSDDKLTQREWVRFVHNVNEAVHIYAKETHFAGASPGEKEWQNYTWVCICDANGARELQHEVVNQRAAHRQDSVAWTEGITQFV